MRLSSKTQCAATCIALVATACGGKKPVSAIDPISDVSGHWRLNDQQSDNAADKIDGGAMKTKMPGQGDDEIQITTKASWSEGWLVIRREVDGGGNITETFLRSPDRQHL